MSRPAKPSLLPELRQNLAELEALLALDRLLPSVRKQLERKAQFLRWEIDALTNRTPFADFSNTQPPTPHRGGEPL